MTNQVDDHEIFGLLFRGLELFPSDGVVEELSLSLSFPLASLPLLERLDGKLCFEPLKGWLVRLPGLQSLGRGTYRFVLGNWERLREHRNNHYQLPFALILLMTG